MKQPISKTYKKGKETLIRKAEELSTLCDIPVCAMIVSPEGKTEIWPESRRELKAVFDRYKEKAQTTDHHDCQGSPKNSVQRDSGKNSVRGDSGKNSVQDDSVKKSVQPDSGKNSVQHDSAKNNQRTHDENSDVDELMHSLNSKIVEVENRIRVLKDIN